MMDAEEILEHIDGCQGALPFLASDGRIHLADARLTVFRSPEKWAVFVEIPHYSGQDCEFVTWVGGAGNCLLEDDCTTGEALGWKPLFEEVAEAPLWKHGVGNEPWLTWLGDRKGFSILFQGKRLDFAPTEADYRAAGIVFGDDKSGPGSIQRGHLLRFLCHHLDHPFFATESELRSLMDDAPDLEVFIQTRHWQHPVPLVDGGSEFDDDFTVDNYIVNIPSFQILSRAIASGDLEEWNSQDTATFNTHWESLEAIYREHLFWELDE